VSPTAPPVVPLRPDAVLDALGAGSVVAIPTDTVYGLAARLDRPGALDVLFALKSRPADVALPVLIGRWNQLRSVAETWPRDASMIAARFWPGPLTVVVPARPEIGPLLGGDGTTVGIRRPAHSFVRALCVKAGPLAVTSANRHGASPSHSAAEVLEAFADAGGALALVVDGGRCDGVPSTVADCTTSPPTCRREGGVPWDWVEAALR